MPRTVIFERTNRYHLWEEEVVEVEIPDDIERGSAEEDDLVEDALDGERCCKEHDVEYTQSFRELDRSLEYYGTWKRAR